MHFREHVALTSDAVSCQKLTVTPGMKAESLGDALPLIITRLCEPKEASYILTKTYVEQHFPHFNVANR